MSSLVAVLSLLAQAPVIDLDHFLGRHIGLDAVSIQAVKNGSIVTKRLPSDDGREIAVFGIARVAFPAEFLSSRFRNIELFKKSYAVPEVGRFGETPSLSDLAGLSVPRKDLEDLERCRIGACKLRLSSHYIQRFRDEVDWSHDDRLQQAELLFKEMLVERALVYQRGGSRALAAYEDKDAAVSLRQDFESILEASSYLLDYVPELASYLREYPNSKLEGTESILYWSKEDFGMKPVISVTHSVLYRWRHGDEEELIIASKQVYASHYFDSSLGLTALLEVEEEGQSPARYLVYLNRSRSLDLGCFFGGLKRSIVSGKIVDGLEMNLLYTRARLQAIYRQQLLER